MSRILHHVGVKDFKKVHQRKLGEQKEVLSEKIKVEKENKKIEEAAKPFKSDWRSTLTESEWYAISGSGPTNSTGQTFAYGEPGSGIEVTLSGIGGVEAHPSTVTIDGETYDAPTYSQLAMQGYAKPLGFGVERRTDFQDVNPYLDASQEFAQAVGADYMMASRVTSTEPQKSFMDAYFEVKGKWDKIIDELQYELQTKYAGQMAPKDLVDKINSLIVQRDAELDALSKKYAGIEPSQEVASPDDDLLDQLAKTLGLGSAKNFLDYYIDNFVKGDGKQNQNLTNLLTRSDKNWLKNVLSKDPAINNPRPLDNPQDAFDSLMQKAPAAIRNSVGNGSTLDMDYYRKTGDYKIDKTYTFTEFWDFGFRGGNNFVSQVASWLGTYPYVLGKSSLNPSQLIQNPMRYHVIIPGPRKKKKKLGESTTWGRTKKHLKGA